MVTYSEHQNPCWMVHVEVQTPTEKPLVSPAAWVFGLEQLFGNQCFASWPWDRSGFFSLHSLLEQSIPVELLSVASRALIASYDFTQFEAQFTVIFI